MIVAETAPLRLRTITADDAAFYYELVNDPTSGLEATGTASNKSEIEQVDLVLYAIARKNGKIVAAGRGQIANLKTSGKPASYHIFFIGNPTGADVTVVAPPVNLE